DRLDAVEPRPVRSRRGRAHGPAHRPPHRRPAGRAPPRRRRPPRPRRPGDDGGARPARGARPLAGRPARLLRRRRPGPHAPGRCGGRDPGPPGRPGARLPGTRPAGRRLPPALRRRPGPARGPRAAPAPPAPAPHAPPARRGPGRAAPGPLLPAPRPGPPPPAGLLPRKDLGIRRQWVAAGLARIAPSFRFGPVLVDPQAIRTPVATDLAGTWTWNHRRDVSTWADDPVVNATGDAPLTTGGAVAEGGWLTRRPPRGEAPS